MKEINDEIVQQNIQPRIFLASTLLPLNVVRQVRKTFAIEYKSIEGKLFFYSKNPNLTHKEKALTLFMAGVFIGCKSAQAALCLGQFNVLEFRLKNHDKPSIETDLSETICEDYINWNKLAGSIYISPILKVYLEQAQILFEGSSVNGQSWATKNLNQAQRKTFPMRKVG